MPSYSHLNIAFLRMELRKIEEAISLREKTIANYELEILKYEREIAKENRKFIPNDISIRSYERSIRNYKRLIRELRQGKEEFGEERAKIKVQLEIKKRRRRLGGTVVAIMLFGFVLINGQGEIKAEVKETSSISDLEDDNMKEQTRELQPDLGNASNDGTDILDDIDFQLEEYLKRLSEKGKEKLEEKKEEFEQAEFWDKTLGEICEDAIDGVLEPFREQEENPEVSGPIR